MNPVRVGNIWIGTGHPPVLIAGPCVIESLESLLETGSRIRDYAAENGFPYILKSSFDKANRTSRESFRGPGLEKGLEYLSRARETVGVPVLTDVHLPEQAEIAAQAVDCLQIPAFLCRQTELIEAAAKTNLPLNIKKGQFLAPEAMRFAVEKAQAVGGGGVLLTERGTCFGYGDLVVDLRSLLILSDFQVPVIFDATHSAQKPAGGKTTGGERRFIRPLAAGAAATGTISGLFLEVHPNPVRALSDAATQFPLQELQTFLRDLRKIFDAALQS